MEGKWLKLKALVMSIKGVLKHIKTTSYRIYRSRLTPGLSLTDNIEYKPSSDGAPLFSCAFAFQQLTQTTMLLPCDEIPRQLSRCNTITNIIGSFINGSITHQGFFLIFHFDIFICSNQMAWLRPQPLLLYLNPIPVPSYRDTINLLN